MIPDILYYILMIGYFFYIIFRFSKPPQSIDVNNKIKKKEPDVHNIEKIYWISSICFVIWTFFVLNPFLTLLVPFHSYLNHFLVLFGIFNAFMTVLYIKYRDDIYFYESYNLCFTLVIIYLAVYFIWNPVEDELFKNASGLQNLPNVTLYDEIIRRFDLPRQNTNRTNSKSLIHKAPSISQGLYHSENFEPVVRQLSKRNSIF